MSFWVMVGRPIGYVGRSLEDLPPRPRPRNATGYDPRPPHPADAWTREALAQIPCTAPPPIVTRQEIHEGPIGELEARAEELQHLCGEPGHEGAVILFAVEMGSAVNALEAIGVVGEAMVGGQPVPIGRRGC